MAAATTTDKMGMTTRPMRAQYGAANGMTQGCFRLRADAALSATKWLEGTLSAPE